MSESEPNKPESVASVPETAARNDSVDETAAVAAPSIPSAAPPAAGAADWREAGLDPWRWIVLALAAVALWLLARGTIGQWTEKTTMDRWQRFVVADGWDVLYAALVALLPYAAVLACRGRRYLSRCAWGVFGAHAFFLLGLGHTFAAVTAVVLLALLLGQRRRTWFVPNACLVIVPLFLAFADPGESGSPIRAYVARTRSDMRSMKTALEAYRADRGVYPPSTTIPRERALRDSPVAMPTFCVGANLTTPVAYFGNQPLPLDRFRLLKEGKRSFAYWSDPQGRGCIALSAGPNCVFDLTPERIEAAWDAERGAWRGERLTPFEYDASNGTVSAGDMWVLSP
jgi:hypothetical protein